MIAAICHSMECNRLKPKRKYSMSSEQQSNLDNLGEKTAAKAAAKPDFFSYEGMKSLAILVTIILAIRWSIASPYHVPTASMEPTIKVGDRLLAYKFAYNFKVPFTEIVLWHLGTPQRGDIIVFKYPKEPDVDYVKRVVGLPGDKIEVINDILFINDKEQVRQPREDARDFLSDIHDNASIKLLYQENLEGTDHWVMQNQPNYRPFSPRNWGPEIIPEKSLFVMGDNRDNSTDSRMWGIVPMENVRGRALFVIWSLHSTDASFLPSVRVARFGQTLYPKITN
jgi:signal peptidase I